MPSMTNSQSPSTLDRVNFCIHTRTIATKIFQQLLQDQEHGTSEAQFCDKLKQNFAEHSDLYDSGWYVPPPFGMSALFATPRNIERVHFDSLRPEKSWPRGDIVLGPDTLGMVYASPVHKPSGTIGDYAATFYNGTDQKIIDHIKNSREAIEQVAELSCVGMRLCDLYASCDDVFAARGLSRGDIVTRVAGSTLGHTVPWTFEAPTVEERAVLESGDTEQIIRIIRDGRLYVNEVETQPILETCAFTVEARLESTEHPELPDVYFHTIVTFREGTRKILLGFESLPGIKHRD